MANVPVPVFRVGGTNAVVTLLYVFVAFSAAHLAAISNPDNRVAKIFLGLGW